MLRALAGTAVAATLAAASPPHYDAVALRNCLAHQSDNLSVAPFSTMNFGSDPPRSIGRRTLVAAIAISRNDPTRFSVTFFSFGRDMADSKRIRAAVRRLIRRSALSRARYAGGSADLNVAWFVVGRLTPTISREIADCLSKSRR